MRAQTPSAPTALTAYTPAPALLYIEASNACTAPTPHNSYRPPVRAQPPPPPPPTPPTPPPRMAPTMGLRGVTVGLNGSRLPSHSNLTFYG